MVDDAGNYVFEFKGETFRVMKMRYRQQRDFFKNVITKAFKTNEFGNADLDLYSDSCDEAQDWLLARIYHKSDESYYPLSEDGLDKYLDFALEKLKMKPVSAVNELFIAGVDALLENFTDIGNTQTQANSNQNVEEDSEATSSPNLLAKTLS